MAGTFVGLAFCTLAVRVFSRCNENRLFSFFGKYSLEIYTMHTYNKYISSDYGCNHFEKNKAV